MSAALERDLDLVAALAELLPDNLDRVSEFERQLAFEVLDRFAADPAGLVVTANERAALEPVAEAMRARTAA